MHRAKSVATDTAEQLLIRLAESQDIDAIIELAWSNVPEGRYKSRIIYDKPKLRMFVGAILADDRARCLVWDECGEVRGVFAFTTFPNFYYFAGQIVANMVIWSVAPQSRGKKSLALLEEAEKEARSLGAKRLLLTGPGENFRKLSEHCGYEFMESIFVKELN